MYIYMCEYHTGKLDKRDRETSTKSIYMSVNIFTLIYERILEFPRTKISTNLLNITY